MCAMHKWEHCVVYTIEYRDGSGGPTRELYEVQLPGAARTSIASPLGAVGVLNQLGDDGWELVDVEADRYFLKRSKPFKTQSAVL